MSRDTTDQMAIGGATLVGLAALTRGGGGGIPGPGPTIPPFPFPDPNRQAYRDASGSVDTTGRVLFGPNAQRTCLMVVNDGDDTVYISLGGPIVHMGIRLNGNGGSLVLEGAGIWYGVVSAIAHSSTSAVTATEVYNT